MNIYIVVLSVSVIALQISIYSYLHTLIHYKGNTVLYTAALLMIVLILTCINMPLISTLGLW